jgi:mannose/fructose/N-acetylgalactosamine-specific phosphotransferase system component IID
MSKNLALIGVVLMVYFTPLGDSFTWQTELAARSALSLSLALFALSLSRKPCALVVAGCEVIALFYNVIMVVGYSLDVVIVDRYYEVVMTTLLVTEIAALILGLLSNELRRLQYHPERSGYGNGTTARNNVLE